MKRQRATLTLVDTEDGQGFTAQIQYQPSLKSRTGNSPAVNAMIRLGLVCMQAKASLGAPLQLPQKKNLTKPTFWQRVLNILTT